MERRKVKAPQLQKHKMIRIGRHKEKNPHLSYALLANLFDVTYDQARRAHKLYLDGKLTQKKPQYRHGDAYKIKEKHGAADLIESQYHLAAAQLEKEKKLAPSDRIKMLSDLVIMMKTFQQVKLQNHIKRADSEIIAAIVRRFEPEADNERVIAVYRETLEKLKLDNK